MKLGWVGWLPSLTYTGMALKGDGASLMLRPMNLRPGGGTAKNPFERFAKGAGTSTSKPIVRFVSLDVQSWSVRLIAIR